MQLELFKPNAGYVSLAFSAPASSTLPTPHQYAIAIAHRFNERPADLHCGECERADLKGVGLDMRGDSSESFPDLSQVTYARTGASSVILFLGITRTLENVTMQISATETLENATTLP